MIAVARLDTGWHANPKVLGSGVYGMALHAWSISYCDDARSDGFVPLLSWPALLHRGVPALVAAKLWETVDGGYRLHDYAQYNRTRAEIESDHAAVTARVTRYRQRKNGVTNGVSNGVTLARVGAPGPGPGLTPGGSGGTDPDRARAREEPPPPPAFFDQLPDEMRARLTRPPLP